MADDWHHDWGVADPGPHHLFDAAVFVEQAVEKAARENGKYRARQEKRTAETTAGGRPIIEIEAGKLDRLATRIEEVLILSGLPVFQRGSSLVRPFSTSVPASRGRTTVGAGLTQMTLPSMLDTYSQVACWARFDKRSKKLLAADPPAQVASVHLSRVGSWHLPRIAGVITAPTMRPDGSVLVEAGYDAATRLYHFQDPDVALPEIPDRPTLADAQQALNALLELLVGFPFVSEVDRAVAVSMLIVPVVRGALSVVPLHAVKATTAGTGKSFLVDVVAAIATGRPCPVAAAAQDAAETEKRLVGLLLSAFPIVSIDNVNGELAGDVLCQIVERPLVRVRPLGKSEIVEIESRACVYATGNALRVSGDMVRRTVLCSLDANVERPELRTFDSNPVATVLADRGRYVAACITIVRAYQAAGSPNQLPQLASFEDWSDLVRSAIVWLGMSDPCASMEQAREDDPELSDLRMVMAGWLQAFGSDATTVRQAIEATHAQKPVADENGDAPTYGGHMEPAHPELRDALVQIAGTRGVIDPRRLGNWLKAKDRKIVTFEGKPKGMQFISKGKSGGSIRWALVSPNSSKVV